MQDTATQAMTEVALGLSMAFFALLILALISVTLPEESLVKDTQKSLQVSLDKSIELHAKDSAEYNTHSPEAAAPVFMFFYEKKWFNSELQKLSIQQVKSSLAESNQDVSENNLLTVVVPSESSFEELLFIQQSLAPNPVQLAEMSEDWRQALAQAGVQ